MNKNPLIEMAEREEDYASSTWGMVSAMRARYARVLRAAAAVVEAAKRQTQAAIDSPEWVAANIDIATSVAAHEAACKEQK